MCTDDKKATAATLFRGGGSDLTIALSLMGGLSSHTKLKPPKTNQADDVCLRLIICFVATDSHVLSASPLR